jgi:hypothetical protein
VISVKKVIGGRRNVTLHITGMLSEGDLPLTPIDLGPAHEVGRAKLSNLLWVVQEKLVVYLYWKMSGYEDVIMPLESRNFVKLDPAMPAPAEWNGRLFVDTHNFVGPQKIFFIALDFDL